MHMVLSVAQCALPEVRKQLSKLVHSLPKLNFHVRTYTRISFADSRTNLHGSENHQSLNSCGNKALLGSPIEQLPGESESPSHTAEESIQRIRHPWPEWEELVEFLATKGYLNLRSNRCDNERQGSKNANSIRSACLNFGRDRVDIIRLLSKKDISIVTGLGCQTIDRKVVNSAKRLRALVGINEESVCTSCLLRGNCERAYVNVPEDENGRTLDVIRVLISYGIDYYSEVKHCHAKSVISTVRKLLKEVVELGASKHVHHTTVGLSTTTCKSGNSAHLDVNTDLPESSKQGDWRCPKCNFLNFGRNIKCLKCGDLSAEGIKLLRRDFDNLPLKKGDWRCEKCWFLNFAKNSRCLICKERPTNRVLNPGEWECDSCNYINFRRNMVCLRCEYRRPKASNFSNTPQVRNRGRHLLGRRFVADENDRDGGVRIGRRGLEFVDFPVAGGKTELSSNLEKQARWKVEVAAARMREEATGEVNSVQKLKPASIIPQLLEVTRDDADDLDEWFQRKFLPE